jgi:hypothetical protein
MVVRVMPVGNALKYSPFNQRRCIEYFEKNQIEIVQDEDIAQLFVSATVPRLMPIMLRYGYSKKYLIWTNEPRFNKVFSREIDFLNLPVIHVFNIYNWFYCNNIAWIRPGIRLSCIKQVCFSKRRAVALMGFRNNRRQWSLIHQGRELDLCYLRTQIALEGNRLEIFDIYGRDWPAGTCKGKSRGGDWRGKKIEILSRYQFNLAFENTNWPYYCTEKIWDAIEGGCLPIYYGANNAIYESFPQDSFIDFSLLDGISELMDVLVHMSEEEYVRRFNRCVDAFNQASADRARLKEPAPIFSLEKTVAKIHSVMGLAQD